jgi:hypothetical protein
MNASTLILTRPVLVALSRNSYAYVRVMLTWTAL